MNLSTALIAAAVAAVFLTIVTGGIWKKKRGKSSCSCGCSGCSMSELCHRKK